MDKSKSNTDIRVGDTIQTTTIKLFVIRVEHRGGDTENRSLSSRSVVY